MLRLAPLFPLAVGLVAGIVCDRAWSLPPLLHLTGLCLVTILLVYRPIREWAPALAIGTMAFFSGGLLHWSTGRCTPATSVERHAGVDGPLVRIRGRILIAPQVLEPPPNPFAAWMPQSQRTSLVVSVDSIETEGGFAPATGRVRVTVYEAVFGLRPFERCEVFGRLLPLTPPANPGAFDWKTYSRTQGICARMVCQHRENVRAISGDAAWQHSLLARLRGSAVELLTGDAPVGSEEESGLLESLLLGQRSQVSARLNEIFLRSGCIHYLSVSGIHVVIVLYLARLACRVLGAGRTATTWVMMLAVVLYAGIAEPRPPILRAMIIGVVYCVARLMGRERAYLNWTSAAAILLLLWNPLIIFDVGFQLSFAAVLGVAYLTPAIKGLAATAGRSAMDAVIRRRDPGRSDSDRAIRRRLKAASGKPPSVLRRLGRWGGRQVWDGLTVSAAAWLAGLPIVAAHFYRMQPWAPLTSTLLMVPVTVTMALGIFKIMAGVLSPTLGALAGAALNRVDALLVAAADHLGQLPGAMTDISPLSGWVTAGFYATLGMAALRFAPGAARAPSTPPWERPVPPRRPVFPLPRFSTRCAVGLLLLGAGLGSIPSPGDGELRITFLSVGRGSSTVIELPGGRTLLYDTGASFSSDPGRGIIVPFLRSRGIARVDRIYVSHPNLDHFSGLPTVLDEVDCGPVVINAYFEPGNSERSPSAHLLDLLRGVGQPIDVLDPNEREWEIDGVRFELLWPGDLRRKMSANDTSNVLRVSFAGRSVLLTGDIDEEAQEGLLAQGDLCADVLVLPHHGSVRRTTRAFIDAVGPSALIRSSDERMDETINGLTEIVRDTPLYNTADHGAVCVVIGPQSFHVSSMLGGDGQAAR